MRRRLSLTARLAWSLAVLGATANLVLAAVIWYAAHDVSRRLMDQTLAAELEDYIARRARNPASLPPAAVGLVGYVAPAGEPDARLPAAVRALPVGRHEISIGRVPYRVAVEERDGWHYVVLFDETRQKRREARFLGYLVGGTAGVTLLVALLAGWLAGRALAPLTRLALAIAAADPERPPRLAYRAQPRDELTLLAEAFDRYFARLAAFLARERAFTADASHELRTPLAVIRGAADLLTGDPGLAPFQRERAQRIERAARRMSELVEALFLLAREDSAAGGVCDAAALARESIERLDPLAAQRAIAIECSAPPTLSLPVAAPLFVIIVTNLARNALDHARTRVRLTLDETALTVADDGPGLAEVDLGRALERHWRGSQSQGAGIGLALVSRICRLAGFSVTLANAREGGFMARVEFSSRQADATA